MNPLHSPRLTRREFVAATGATTWRLFSRRAGAADPCASLVDAEAQAAKRAMILIPGGRAVVGTDSAEAEALAKKYNVHPSWLANETPRRIVEVAPFSIDRFPVTNADYLVFCQATGRQWVPAGQGQLAANKLALLPATFVNREDATAYAKWCGRRLPTEVEWEYAARGANGLAYPWGHDWDPTRCNSNEQHIPGGRGPTPVHAYPSGVSPFGVMDMVGNVCEWTADNYADAPRSGVVKGGFWLQHEAYRFRAACRMMSQLADNRQDYIGFRCAKDGRPS